MAHADTDSAHPGHRRIGALLLIRNDSGHPLLVKPTYREGWQLPGGGAQPGEPPAQAAMREVEEETGLNVVPGVLLIMDYVRANPNSGAVEGFNFCFDGGTVADTTRLILPTAEAGKEPELADARFIPPAELEHHCQPYQHRRITEALLALADPTQRGYRFEGNNPLQQ